MKSICAYLMTALVSLTLVVASALLPAGSSREANLCVSLLFGLVFCWSAVKAVLSMMEDQDAAADTVPLFPRVLMAA